MASSNDRPEDQSFSGEDEFRLLLESARSGSSEAMGLLIENCRPYLLFLANKGLDDQVRAKIGASDVVQETLFAAQNELENFRGQEIGEWLGWLRQILNNDLLQTRRRFRDTAKRQVDREVDLNGDGSRGPIDVAEDRGTPGTKAMIQEEAEHLREAMNRLPEDYQEVIRLRDFQGLTFKEVGEQMGRTTEAVRKLWYRAFLQLKRELFGNE